jgi:hypothetical protein
MGLFWVFVVVVGIVGAVADITLNSWSKTLSLQSFTLSAVLFIAFMVGLGITMRLGATRGYSVTLALLLVVLANVAGVACWDIFNQGTRFTSLQWLGALMTMVAIICFEFGKK